jgi:hypothetical protein
MNEKKYYVIDNVILKNDLFNLYNDLINAPVWHISRATTDKTVVGMWPGFIVKNNEEIRNHFWYGRFWGLLENIKNVFQKENNFSLPANIARIHVGAKNTTSNTDFHTDVFEPYTYTIVGFITPEWSQEWGGELNIEGEIIDFKPGRFVIFKSELRHDGSKIKKEINHWKISLNYVLRS